MRRKTLGLNTNFLPHPELLQPGPNDVIAPPGWTNPLHGEALSALSQGHMDLITPHLSAENAKIAHPGNALHLLLDQYAKLSQPSKSSALCLDMISAANRGRR